MSTTMINGDIIQFGRNAYYNKYGLLDWMNFYYTNQSWENNDKKSIFSVYNFYDSPKPSYIRVNESDIYDYGIFYSERNAPIIPLRNYSNLPKKFSIKVNLVFLTADTNIKDPWGIFVQNLFLFNRVLNMLELRVTNLSGPLFTV